MINQWFVLCVCVFACLSHQTISIVKGVCVCGLKLILSFMINTRTCLYSVLHYCSS